ncbi:MAG: hypothetical protein V4556_12495 [Bacteroidota bacterium]
MKLQIVISLISCLLFLNAAGQKTNLQTKKSSNNVQVRVNHIDSVIKKITADTNIIYTTVEVKNKKDNNNYIINAGYKNDHLVILQKTSTNFFLIGWRQVFYFDKGEAVLYALHYSNSSRMGSCGQVFVGFSHYLKDSIPFAGITKSLTSHYTCYGYQLEKPAKKTLIDQIDNMTGILKKNNATVNPAKVTLPFFGIPLNFNEWPTQESYGF